MARRSFTDLVNQNASLLPDNTTGQISPSDVRTCVSDLTDTVQPAYAVLSIGTPQAISVGETIQDFTLWDTNVITTSEFSSNLTTGVITANIPMVVDFQVNLTFQVGTSENLRVSCSDSSGVLPYVNRAQGQGSGDPAYVAIGGIYDATAITPNEFKVRIENESGTSTYTFTEGVVALKYVPRLN